MLRAICIFLVAVSLSSGAAIRREIEVAGSGWVRLPLDASAQALADESWIGDEDGHPLPFLRESDRPSQVRSVEVSELLAGRDVANRPTVEFTLEDDPPADGPGWDVDLRLESTAPWAARVEVARQREGGEWVTLADGASRHVFDFGEDARRVRVSFPRDASRYRITLNMVTGEAPEIAGLSASRRMTRSGEPRPEAARITRRANQPGVWDLTVDQRLRVRAIELEFSGRFAPVGAQVFRTGDAGELIPIASGAVWNLPALDSAQVRVELPAPQLADGLVVQAPASLELDRVRWIVAEESWLLPAEAGLAMYLYSGSGYQVAPGDLTRLAPPAPDADLPVASLGPPMPDPHARPPTLLSRAERHLPWLIAIGVAAVAWIALRLLRPPEEAEVR